jgi:hypothetical protein
MKIYVRVDVITTHFELGPYVGVRGHVHALAALPTGKGLQMLSE